MLIYVKIIKKIKKKISKFYINFKLIYVKKNCFSSDGQTDVKLKTIVRNLTKKNFSNNFLFNLIF